jgi:hypothetical protein
MNNTLTKRAAHLTLRLSLGGLALLFLHTPSVKAQECCPDADQYAARVEAPAKKPVRPTTNHARHAKAALVAKRERIAAPRTNAAREANNLARAAKLEQPAEIFEKKE